MGNSIERCAFPVPSPAGKIDVPYQMLPTSSGDQIPVVFIRYAKNPTIKTMIYSHGNATDLGRSVAYLQYLSRELKVNVIGYDYLGYGLSQVNPSNYTTCLSTSSYSSPYPSEQGCYSSLEAVYNWTIYQLGFKTSDIILMGQSIGCGPTVDIASKNHHSAAVILISPFMTAAKVVTNTSLAYPVDFFCNDRKMQHISVPILIVHGTADDVIPYLHGKHLASMNEKCSITLIADADHNNLDQFPEYLNALRAFLEKI